MGNRNVVTRVAPHFVMRLLGRFDPTLRSILRGLGSQSDFSGARAKAVLGVTYMGVTYCPADQSL